MSIQHPVALEVPLTPTSYLVLGLLEREGPSTPYELKRHVAATIGHIWSFPHALLYKEPARLAALGLLSEERELVGRRRRLFTITPAGREALRIWLGRPAQHPTELRDLALLQLFFSDLESTEVTLALADEQLDVASASARELRGRPGPGEPDREPDDGTLARRHRQDGIAVRTRGDRVLGTGRRRRARIIGRRRLSEAAQGGRTRTSTWISCCNPESPGAHCDSHRYPNIRGYADGRTQRSSDRAPTRPGCGRYGAVGRSPAARPSPRTDLRPDDVATRPG